MTWLKQNLLVVVSIVVVVAVAYYLLAFLPQRELTAKVDNCRRIGEEYRKNEIKENPSLSFLTPRYAYSKKLDTCIYSGGFSNYNNAQYRNITKYVMDLNTNQEIVSTTYSNNERLDGVYMSEFTLKEMDLFKEVAR